MQTIHTLTLYTHILFGSAALMLFWIAITAPKGRLNHIKFGRYYSVAIHTVAFSGAITALMVLWDPMTIHGGRLSNPENEARFVDAMRVFYSLLLYLSVLVYAGLRQGMLSLKYKQRNSELQKADVLLANGALILGAPLLFYFGMEQDQKLPMIFSALGLLSGISHLRYAFAKQTQGNAWLREHIGAMIGTGIAAHTAFFAFGGRTLFGDIGNLQLFFWIAPGVIGSFAIRYYAGIYAPQKEAVSRPITGNS